MHNIFVKQFDEVLNYQIAYNKFFACTNDINITRADINWMILPHHIIRAVGTGGRGDKGVVPPQIFPDQLTLFQPGRGADYSQIITSCPKIFRPSAGSVPREGRPPCTVYFARIYKSSRYINIQRD